MILSSCTSSFIIYYYSFLLNIFPSLAVLSDLEPGLCFICAYNTLSFMTSPTSFILLIHLRCSLHWETLPDTLSLLYALYAPLASCACLFHNIYHIVLCLPDLCLCFSIRLWVFKDRDTPPYSSSVWYIAGA